MKLFSSLLLRNSRTTDSLRPGRVGEFLAGWSRANSSPVGAVPARPARFLRNSRTTDSLRPGRVGEFLAGWSRANSSPVGAVPVRPVRFLRNSRTTDSLRPGRVGEFLARWSRACAACALLCAALLAQDPLTRKPDRVVTLVAERFTFNPSKVTVRQGDLVEFVVTSDDTDHGFRILSAGIDAAIPQQGKGELRVRFLANEKGQFVFECSRPCGAGHNLMRGTLVVR